MDQPRGVPGYRNVPAAPWNPDTPVDPAEAEAFIRLYHAENPRLGDPEPRLAEIRNELTQTGVYTHTPAELTFGARVAWRNSSRCIGRLYWNSLVVIDRRDVTTSADIAEALVAHLRAANSDGAIRPIMSVFAPARPGRPFARLWNDQLVRYAGYVTADGDLIGDPRYREFTDVVTRLGWRGKNDQFDVLPLVVETPEEGPRLYELPEDAVLEVPLTHPDHRWFEELGVRWHAVPAISNMRLTIGGLHYPLAPFNGWYMGTEIGARNLADPDRYDLLPLVARRLNLDMSHEATLWRDRALVELNRAVLYSFARAGVKIADHHTEARRFVAHVEREHRNGRPAPADWSWIVPPLSGAATAVFHRYYEEADLRPNLYLDAEARYLAQRGRPVPAPGVPPERIPVPTGDGDDREPSSGWWGRFSARWTRPSSAEPE